jgi:hypothetical protein
LLIRLAVVFMVSTAFSPLLSAAAALPPGGTFVDDDASQHQGAIEAISAAGITYGCNPPDNDRFCPNDPVTRGQMAAFLARALDLSSAPQAGFTDTADSVFSTDIDRLAAAGITYGCNPPENDRFCPNDPVTRGQMAAFLARALKIPVVVGDTFIDIDGSPFRGAIAAIHGAGLTTGCNPPENDRFCPNDAISRAQMATFLSRALDLTPISVTPRRYQVAVIGRDGWGAAPPRGTFAPNEIEHITIHHSDTSGGVTGPAQFRSWQQWHFHLGWPDIAYHFIIGRDGKVYEGRPYTAVGDTATEYDPTGHLLIVLEGDFNIETPTDAQLEMLAEMVAWGSMQFNVDVATIQGHRDLAATSCPGDNLYARITDGSIAGRAAEILAAGGITLDVQP